MQSKQPNRSAAVPELRPGITCLAVDESRSPAFHEIALASLPAQRVSFWIDSRNVANTYRLYDLAATERALSGLRIARAFTAHQHYSLCRELVSRVTPHTGLVCLPNLTSLYRDDDVPEYERDILLDSVLDGLSELADTYELPVLVSTTHDDDLAERVMDIATETITCEVTPFGVRYDGATVKTTLYRDGAYWQTTIPYWVDLFGAVDDGSLANTADAYDFAGVV